jgi:hypothetical protein
MVTFFFLSVVGQEAYLIIITFTLGCLPLGKPVATRFTRVLIWPTHTKKRPIYTRTRYSILHYKPGKMVFTGEWRI